MARHIMDAFTNTPVNIIVNDVCSPTGASKMPMDTILAFDVIGILVVSPTDDMRLFIPWTDIKQIEETKIDEDA